MATRFTNIHVPSECREMIQADARVAISTRLDTRPDRREGPVRAPIAQKRSSPMLQPPTPHKELGSMRSHRFPYLSVNTATVPYASRLGSSSNSTPRFT